MAVTLTSPGAYRADPPWSNHAEATPLADLHAACFAVTGRPGACGGWVALAEFPVWAALGSNKNPQDFYGRRGFGFRGCDHGSLVDLRCLLTGDGLPRPENAWRDNNVPVPPGEVWVYEREGDRSPRFVLRVG
jgi:hypothetical protein